MRKNRQLFFDFQWRNNYSLNDIIIGDFNSDVIKVLFSSTARAYPIIYIYGNEGVGKTYLGNIYLKQQNGCYLSKKDFSSNIVNSLIDKYSVFFLDDLQNLSPEEELELFNIYNNIVNNGKQLLITARTTPNNLNIKLPDLSSRLLGGVILQIKELDEISLNIMLFKLLTDRQLIVSKYAINYILKRIPRDAKSLQEVVDKLEQGAMLNKKTLTIFAIKEILNI